MNEDPQIKELVDTMASKRSPKGSYCDPVSEKNVKPGFWNNQRINACSPKLVNQMINPSILSKDQKACNEILTKIVAEKEKEMLKKTWHKINRDYIRAKFIETHEKNI